MKKNVDEKALVESLKARDQAAWSAFYESNRSRVYGIASRFQFKHTDPEDIVQETFTQAFVAIDQFSGKSSVRTWLYKISANECLDRYRKDHAEMRKGEVAMGDLSRETLNEASREPSPEHLAIKGELEDIAVGLIPAEARAVMILRYLEELSMEEVSEATGQIENTVKVQIFRGRQKARKTANRKQLNLHLDSVERFSPVLNDGCRRTLPKAPDYG
jgi:RNA polymerase sigma-70 factor (ECF subfamily)